MLTPAAAAALSVPECEDVVEREDRGRQRAARQLRRHCRCDLVGVEAGLDHLGPCAGHRGQRLIDPGHPLADVADLRARTPPRAADDGPWPAAARRPSRRRRHCPRPRCRTLASSSGRSRTTNGMPSRSSAARAAKVPSQGTAITPAGRQAISASTWRVSSAGIAAAGRDQQPPPCIARLALQPVDHLGEEWVAELGHDGADDGALGAAQGRGGDVALVAQLVDDQADAVGEVRVDVAPTGQHVGHGRRRDGGRARDVVNGRPPPRGANAQALLAPIGHRPPQ